MREIVDSCGGVTKNIDKFVYRIIKKYATSEYTVKNSSDFVESIKNVTVPEDSILVSYDVVALYPSIPQSEAIDLIHELLRADETLHETTSVSPDNITELYKLCVQQTYFMFNHKLYKQVHGLAIGASTSGFAADIYLFKLETRAITTFADPPDVWKRFVDDTFSILKLTCVESFLQHLNSQHPSINFTTET